MDPQPSRVLGDQGFRDLEAQSSSLGREDEIQSLAPSTEPTAEPTESSPLLASKARNVRPKAKVAPRFGRSDPPSFHEQPSHGRPLVLKVSYGIGVLLLCRLHSPEITGSTVR